jgi:hypothetical protein
MVPFTDSEVEFPVGSLSQASFVSPNNMHVNAVDNDA